MLQLAEKFGCSPGEVEQWDEYWFNRAVEFTQGEVIHQNKTAANIGKKPRRTRNRLNG